jgi:hypothetical protein
MPTLNHKTIYLLTNLSIYLSLLKNIKEIPEKAIITRYSKTMITTHGIKLYLTHLIIKEINKLFFCIKLMKTKSFSPFNIFIDPI